MDVADAKTELIFTLNSGDTPVPDPDPDPDPTPTPPVPETTTPTSPNTGDYTVDGNIGGTVFGALFLVIGLAALVTFLVKYFKENRRLSFARRGTFRLSMRPRVFATVGLSLAFALLGGLMITKFTNTNPTNAITQRNVQVTAKAKITFNVARGTIGVQSDTISVANNGYPYDLYMYTDKSTFCHTTSTDACLNSVTGNIISTTGLSDMSGTNTWGVSVNDEDPTPVKSIWAAAPIGSNTKAKIASRRTDSNFTFSYAVNVGTDLPDGTYVANVFYRAVAEIPDDPEERPYNVQTITGFIGEEGEEDDEDFYEDEEVVIRPNCGAGTTFTGWQINKGNILKLSDITRVSGSTNLYHFTMPAEDVIIEALCTPDTPSSKWIIKYNKNISTASGTMADTEVTTTSATLRTNSFTLSNSTFLGWSCVANLPWAASLKDFNNNASVTEASLVAADCTPTTSGGVNTYTVYAIWKADEPTWIQDVTAEYCDSLEFFEVKTLKDNRDKQSYSFAKYADGRCWMLQDLAYQPGTGSITLTKEGTDINSNTKTVTFSNSSTANASYHVQSGYSILYNFMAATAGTYDGSQSADTTIGSSLCPASWKLPDAQNQSGKFADSQGELYGLHHYNIGSVYGGGSSKSVSWNRNTFLFSNSNISLSTGGTAKALNFKYSGAWDFGDNAYAKRDGGTRATAGTYSSYFMSTVREDNMIAAMNPHSNDPSDADLRNGETEPIEGSSVRCLLRTAKQRTSGNRSAPVKEADITGNTNPDGDDYIWTYNQKH